MNRLCSIKSFNNGLKQTRPTSLNGAANSIYSTVLDNLYYIFLSVELLKPKR